MWLKFITTYVAFSYYEMRRFYYKYDSYYKMWPVHYKIRQLLQNIMNITESVGKSH